MNDLVTMDIETTSLSPFLGEVLCVGIFSPDQGYDSPDLRLLEGRCKNTSPALILHNAKFDLNFLRRKGCDLRKFLAYDTRSLATILCPIPPITEGQRHSFALENLYLTLLKGEAYKSAPIKSILDGTIKREDLLSYNQKDCEITWKLFDYLVKHFNEKDWQFVENWLMPATKLIGELEYNGVFIDRRGLEVYREEVEGLKAETLKNLFELTEKERERWKLKQIYELQQTYDTLLLEAFPKARNKEACHRRYQALFNRAKEKVEPFNFNSSVQLKWLLKDCYGFDLLNPRSGKETTDEAQLKELSEKSAVARELLKFRGYEKLLSSCIPALLDHVDADLRVHPSFNLGGTRTGRLSSSSPNMQNVPKGRLRSFIKAPVGYQLFIADYAQIEVRILAELSKEEKLIEAFKEGVDPYGLIAKQLFRLDVDPKEVKQLFPKHRDVAKTAGLSILYGTGAARLRELLKKELGLNLLLYECRLFIDNYRDSFPAIKEYKSFLEDALANQNKYYNLLGRPIYIENNEDLYMTALNTVVQGSASDLVVRAAVKIQASFPELRPILLVHDEMVFEVPDELCTKEFQEQINVIATKSIEEELSLRVPLKIEACFSDCWEKP